MRQDLLAFLRKLTFEGRNLNKKEKEKMLQRREEYRNTKKDSADLNDKFADMCKHAERVHETMGQIDALSKKLAAEELKIRGLSECIKEAGMQEAGAREEEEMATARMRKLLEEVAPSFL